MTRDQSSRAARVYKPSASLTSFLPQLCARVAADLRVLHLLIRKMQVEDCPLPEVASALSPFIKTREEVSTIRRNLQAHLQSNLPLEESTPLSVVNLTTPFDDTLSDPPTALTGVRRAYWKALQANQAAQAKYDGLKADLEALKRPGPATTLGAVQESAPAPSINETHIPLLRAKEKLRRLRVLEKAFSSLPALPTEPLEDQLRAQLGEQPTPPSTHPPSSSNSSTGRSPDVEARILELKKAVLTTKRRVEDQTAQNAVSRASLPANEELSSAARIAGLQSALGELTGWMEEMLGVIAEAEADAAEKQKGSSAPATPARTGRDAKASLEEIERGYERYLQARKRLVQAIASPPPDADEEDENGVLFDIPSTGKAKQSRPPKPSAAESLLPFITTLTAAKRQEATILQQNAHIRRHLTASEAQTAQLLQRLAGESHLVSPGACRGKDWADASKEAGAESEKALLDRIRAGEVLAGAAREAMEGIERAPDSMSALLKGGSA